MTGTRTRFGQTAAAVLAGALLLAAGSCAGPAAVSAGAGADPASSAVSASGSVAVEVPGGVVQVAIPSQPAGVSRAQLLAWVEGSAKAVASYYGKFPVPRVDLTIRRGGSGRIGGGRTEGWSGRASIVISVGDGTTDKDLMADWELTHEMVHLAFPSMPRGKSWIEEGIAVYVEPIARARAGRASADNIWRWMTKGAADGLAGVKRRGLDESRSWGATYWGGALFCLLADVEIRERTGNKKALDDALRGILRAGGNVTVNWDLDRAFAEGDKATGVPVLTELHAKMGSGPVDVDLPALWKKLGISVEASGIVYDDTAPLSAVRRSIATGR